MSLTIGEIKGVIAAEEAKGDAGDADLLAYARSRLAGAESSAANLPNASKLPNMDAYLAKCVSRCRPKGAN